MAKIIQFPTTYKGKFQDANEKRIKKFNTAKKILDNSPVTIERVKAVHLYYACEKRFLFAAPYELQGRGIERNEYWDKKINNENWYGYDVTQNALERLSKLYPLIRTAYRIAIKVKEEADSKGYRRMNISEEDIAKYYTTCCE